MCLGVPKWPHFGVLSHACFSTNAPMCYTVVLLLEMLLSCPPKAGLFVGRGCGLSCSTQSCSTGSGARDCGQTFLGLPEAEAGPWDRQPSQAQGLCWEPPLLQSVPLKTVKSFSGGPRSPKPIGQTFWNWGPICIKMKTGFIEILLALSAAKPGRKGKF